MLGVQRGAYGALRGGIFDVNEQSVRDAFCAGCTRYDTKLCVAHDSVRCRARAFRRYLQGQRGVRLRDLVQEQ